MNWREHLTPVERQHLRDMEERRAVLRKSISTYTAEISRARNMCILRERRRKEKEG